MTHSRSTRVVRTFAVALALAATSVSVAAAKKAPAPTTPPPAATPPSNAGQPTGPTGLSPEILKLNDEATADTALTGQMHAHAVLLLDEQHYLVRPDGSASIVVHRAVRIQTPYGRQHYRMVFFHYNALTDQPRMEFAGTRMPNGQWAAAGAEALKDTLIQSVGPFRFYHNLRQYVYLLPDPQPGAIVEYQYVIERQAQALPGHFEMRIEFQTEDPIMRLARTLTVPESLALHLFPGASTPAPTIATAQGERVYTWAGSHLPGVLREYGSAPTNPTTSVLVSTTSSWRELATTLAREFEEASRPTPAIQQLVKATVGTKRGEAAQHAVYALVASSVPFIQLFDFQVTGVRPDPAEVVWQNRAADGKDHATLLGACLRAAGFPVTFALSNMVTQPDTTTPALMQWNHVFLQTTGRAGRTIWLDSSTETAPFGVLPGPVQGKTALLLKATGPLFTRPPIAPASENVDVVTLDLTIDEKGNLSGTMRTTPHGVTEMQERMMLKRAGRAGRREFFAKRLAFIAPDGELTKFQISPPGDLATPFGVTLSVNVPKWGRVVQDTILGLLPPGFTAFPTTGLAQWVYDSERKTPLDVSVLAPTFRIEKHYTLHIPEGYRVGVHHPEPLRNRVGSFAAAWSLSGTTVQLTEVLTVEKGWITPDIYPDLRELWFAVGEFETLPVRLIKKAV